MKKLKFVIPPSRSFQVYSPDFSFRNNTKSQILLKLITTLNLFLLFLFLLTIFLGRFIYSDLSSETSTYIYAVMLLGSMLLLYLTTIILGGSKKFIDPPQFIGVLVFALLATSAAVFTNDANVTKGINLANTFGILNFRGAGGLTIMLEVILFYIISVYITNITLFKRSLRFLTFSSLAFVTVLALTTSANLDLITINLGEVALALVLLFTLGVLIFKRSYRLLNFSLLLILSVVLLLLINTNSQFYNNLLIVLLSIFFASLGVFILFFITKAEWTNEKINDLRASFNRLTSQKKLSDFFIEMMNTLVLLTPLLVFLVIALLLVNKNVSFDLINSKILEIRDAANAVFVLSDIKRTILGLGGASYSTAKSFITNIILVQGLFGLLAYLVIWCYGIVQTFLLLKRFKTVDTTFKLGVLLLFVLIFIPVYSIFSLTTVSMLFLWWIAFGLVGVLINIQKNKVKELYTKEDWEVGSLKIGKRDLLEWGYYLKYLFIILTLVGGAYIIYNLLSIILS